MEAQKSIIGKKFYPVNNSYSSIISKDKAKERFYLAGTVTTTPVLVEAVSEPYEESIENIVGEQKTYTFINVSFEGNIYRILYIEGIKDRNTFCSSEHDGSMIDDEDYDDFVDDDSI
jgi:hypothetical protein